MRGRPRRMRRRHPGTDAAMFLFFSSGLGCFGSLLLSAAVTAILVLLFVVL